LAWLSIVSEPQITFAVDATPIWKPVSSILYILLCNAVSQGDLLNAIKQALYKPQIFIFGTLIAISAGIIGFELRMALDKPGDLTS
jgi:hypothetical protein